MSVLIASFLVVAGDPFNCDRAVFVTRQSAERERLIAETRALQDESKEIGEKRADIASRLEELAQMNPIRRGLKGTFDQSYDGDALRAEDKALADELKLLSEKAGLVKTQTDLLDIDREQFLLACGTGN